MAHSHAMTIKLEHLLLVLGGTLLAVALFLGFMPVTADGASCGGALTGANALTAACVDALSARRTLTWALIIPALVLIGAGVWVYQGPQNDPSPETPGAARTT